MSNMVKTLLTLHLRLGKPMSKSSVLSICRIVELIKCVQYTFHRQAITVADHLLLTINHYELALLTHLHSLSVSM
jgi:WASH complex subunit 7